MAGLQQGRGGLSRDASVGRSSAEADAVYGEARRFDAQSYVDGRVREGVAFAIRVSIIVTKSRLLLIRPL